MITTAIAWLKARALAIYSGVAVAGAIVLRMVWLKSQRDTARTERDNAISERKVGREQERIADRIDEERADLQHRHQEKRIEEDREHEETGRRGGLENKW